MSYEFALDKKAVISMIAGSVVIAVLLFFAGWVVGSQWTTHEAASTTSDADDDRRAELPKEPVLNEEEQSAPKANSPKSAKPDEKLPAESNGTSPEAQPATATSATSDQVAIISEAEAGADPENGAAASEPEYVTVQVGVFLSEKDASSLLKQIESKGYAPNFYTGRDAEARQWYAVRIGVYSDREQAAKAASNFTRQEKIKAVVRPLESL